MRRIVRHRRRGRGRRSDPIRTLRHGGHPHRRSPKHEVRRDDRLHAEKRIRDLHGSHGSRRVEMQRHPQLAELHGDGSRRLGSGSRSRRRHHDRDHLAGRTHDELHAQRSRPRREHFADLRRRRDDQKPTSSPTARASSSPSRAKTPLRSKSKLPRAGRRKPTSKTTS